MRLAMIRELTSRVASRMVRGAVRGRPTGGLGRRSPLMIAITLAALIVTTAGAGDRVSDQSGDQAGELEAPTERIAPSRSERILHGWTVLVDDRLQPRGGAAEQGGDDAVGDDGNGDDANARLGQTAIQFLESKLFDISLVMPAERLQQLRQIRIVLDLECGDLGNMQYHPSRRWLIANGYQPELEKCVHIPVAAQLATARNAREQPWVILHELAHAFHDTVLGFDHAAVRAAYERYRDSGRGEQTLLFNGQRVRHYGLTNEREFFAEMTESLFGSNDFYPFNRAELMHEDRALYQLLCEIWLVEANEGAAK